jgi:hypothetical protein
LPVVRAANKSKEEEEKEEGTGGPPRELEVPGLPRPSIGPRLVPSGLAHVPFVPAPFPPPPGVHQSPASNVVKPAGIPNDWVEKPTRKKGGAQWFDPNNSNNVVRSMPADPNSPYSHQQVPYTIDQDGSFRDVDGNVILGSDPGSTPDAHIPTKDFKFKRP